MRLLKLVARLANEHERNLRNRLMRARALIVGSDRAINYLHPSSAKPSGRVYLFTTFGVGKGESDFLHILQRRRIKVRKTIRINWKEHGSSALSNAILSNTSLFKAGDIIAIVRGGGDTRHRQFNPFRSPSACQAIRRLIEEVGVIVVTGIGHKTDNFMVENVVSFKQVTPTDAANKICELLQV